MSSRLGLAVILAATTACSAPGTTENSRSGPALAEVAEITLAEADSLYIGAPSSLRIGSDSSLYVADYFASRVVRYDRQGSPVQTYGERGSGPGELEGLGKVFLVDSLLVAEDFGDSNLEVYHVETGEYLRSRDYHGILGGIVVEDTLVWMGNQSQLRDASMLLWRLGTDDLEYRVRRPPEYRRSEPLSGVYTTFPIALSRDTVLVGYMGLDRLTVLDRELNRLGSVRVPTERRRAQPEDLVRTMNEATSAPEHFAANSFLLALSRLPDGKVGLVHYDQEMIDTSARRVAVDVYVSLLSRDLERACVDRPLPVAEASQPLVTFRGDSLFVLQQEVLENRRRARTFVEIYRVSSKGCDWRPAPSADTPGTAAGE